MQLYYLVYIPMFFIAWALAYPVEALALIDNLKQRLHHYAIECMTRQSARLLKERFRKLGKLDGYEQALIDDVLNRHTPMIIKRLETRYSQVTLDELLS